MSSQVASFNPAAHLNAPYGHRVCLSSQRIIETASYSTTPSFTPPAKEYHPFSAHDHHRTGPTIAAVVLAIQALKLYRDKEEKPVTRPTSVPVGNYQRACAEQAARRQQMGGASNVRDTSSGQIRTEVNSERDMCPWSYEDQKRKMHLSLMCVEEAWTNWIGQIAIGFVGQDTNDSSSGRANGKTGAKLEVGVVQE
ncbi:hypothetical protein MMC30_003878 [Trapelia coarctata]|nr:hypothetical protein [Trapelia coarctata]